MPRVKIFGLWAAAILLTGSASAAEPRVLKILPHYLDLKGRESLSPSLYERDAYQAILRRRPAERSAIRFNVQWKAKAAEDHELKLRVEARGARGNEVSVVTLEKPVRKTGWLTSWTALTLEAEAYKNFGELVAFRATLWDGEKMLAEQKSFLW